MANGRFSSVDDAVDGILRAGAEALKERDEDAKLAILRAALDEGEKSGMTDDYSLAGTMRDIRARHAG